MAEVEVDTEKLMVDVKTLTEDIRGEDDRTVADGHAVRVAVAEISNWKKKFEGIQTLLFSNWKTIKVNGHENSRLVDTESAVNNLQSEMEMTVSDIGIEYEDKERHLFTLSKSESPPVKMPTFSGAEEESFQDFEKELSSRATPR